MGTGNAAGETNLAEEVSGNGFGLEHLWLEMTLSSLTFHSPLRVSQVVHLFFCIVVEFVH